MGRQMSLALVAAVLFAQSGASSYYTPDEAQALFREGNDAYYKGRTEEDERARAASFAAAKGAYLKLIEHGFDGADVLFNLGTVCLANNELGEAVLYLERARRLKRSDDVEANLTVARERQGDQLVGGASAISEPFLTRLADATGGTAVSLLALVALWLTLALAVLFRRMLPGTRGWLAFLLVMSGITATVSTALVAVDAWVAANYVEGVVMPKTAQVREVPNGSARVSFEVHAGLKVRVLEESGKFVRIHLSNSLEGWVEREGVVPL
jgi:hypothetical protein